MTAAEHESLEDALNAIEEMKSGSVADIADALEIGTSVENMKDLRANLNDARAAALQLINEIDSLLAGTGPKRPRPWGTPG